MADINRRKRPPARQPSPSSPGPEGQELPEARIARTIELLFFAYRDFTSDPDAILAERGFGRAHHRILHFVSRYPGLRVADLLDILKITKQSLARVLRQLIEEGLVEQREGPVDRRERLLYTTGDGASLARRLMEPQIERVAAALGGHGDGMEACIESFLFGMIDAAERERVAGLIGRDRTATSDEEDRP